MSKPTREQAARLEQFRAKIAQGREKLDLAIAYLDDGAYASAADNLRKAADLFEAGNQSRNAAWGALPKVVS